MPVIKNLLKEPIIHFIVAGALLYSAAYWIRGPQLNPAEETEIVVSRDTMLEFLQFRANAFDPESFALALDTMSDEDINQFIDEYIEEEVLYRESKSLSLDASDYIIRQRMVQKMSFLLSDLAGGAESTTDENVLSEYFQDNIDAYLIKPSITFTHIYFDHESRGDSQAQTDADNLKNQFNQSGIDFNGSNGEGDRFPFLRNYVERTLDYVQGHFGTEFSTALQNIDPSDSLWQGPFQSAFGYHIVLVTDLRESTYPTLAQVRETVERDYREDLSEAQLAEMIDSVKNRYQVTVEAIRQEAVEE